MNIMRLSLFTLSFALLLAFSASEGGAMVHKKKKSKTAVVQACVQAAKTTCEKTASDECSSKSGFKKSLCEKTSKQVCMETAKTACEKTAG